MGTEDPAPPTRSIDRSGFRSKVHERPIEGPKEKFGGDLASTEVAKPKARAVLACGARKFTVSKQQKPTTMLSSLSLPN